MIQLRAVAGRLATHVAETPRHVFAVLSEQAELQETPSYIRADAIGPITVVEIRVVLGQKQLPSIFVTEVQWGSAGGIGKLYVYDTPQEIEAKIREAVVFFPHA